MDTWALLLLLCGMATNSGNLSEFSQEIKGIIDLKEVLESSSAVLKLAGESKLAEMRCKNILKKLDEYRKTLQAEKEQWEVIKAKCEHIDQRSSIEEKLKDIDLKTSGLDKEVKNAKKQHAIEVQRIVFKYIAVLLKATETAIEVKFLVENSIPDMKVEIINVYVRYESLDPINAVRRFATYDDAKNLAKYVLMRMQAK